MKRKKTGISICILCGQDHKNIKGILCNKTKLNKIDIEKFLQLKAKNRRGKIK